MRSRVLLLSLSLAGCSGTKSGSARLDADERAVRDFILAHTTAPKLVEFHEWGPNDAAGSLWKAAAERRAKGQLKFRSGLVECVGPATHVVRVRYKVLDEATGRPEVRDDLFFVEHGRVTPRCNGKEHVAALVGAGWLEAALNQLD